MTKWLLIFALIFAPFARAVTVSPIAQPHMIFVDASGIACASCSLYTYAAGTTNPQATYTDSTGGSQNTNPIVLGTDGGANIWFSTSSYKLVLKSASGVTIWTIDNVPGSIAGNYLALSGGTLTGSLSGTSATFSGAVTKATSTTAGAGTFSGSTNNCLNQSQINGGAMTMWVAGAVPTMDAVCGMSIIPSTSTATQSDGVTGMVDNYTSGAPGSGGTAAVGGYFQARGYANNAHIWGTNWALIANSTNNTMQNEIDTDINNASYTGTIIVGLNVSGPFWNAAPLSAEGVKIFKPGGTSAALWNVGFDSAQGASTVAFLAQASGIGNSFPSQPLIFYNTDAGGVQRGSQINSDATGSFQFSPYGSTSYFNSNLHSTGILSAPNLSINSSQNLNGVQGTTGANIAVATGTFATGHLRSTDSNGNEVDSGVGIQTCVTGSIAPGSSAGSIATGTCTIGTSATGHPGVAAATDGSVQGIVIPQVSVSGTTVTVTITTVVAGSPTAKGYNVTVF